ncbi:MAG: twin-arginine translocation signal domain-containing protein [Eggerthellaceae bacterium]
MSTNDRTSASAPVFSRRGFLSLLAATGTVVAFGNGSELFVRVAHADEAGVGDPYTLYVVKRWEVPVYLFDVTDPANLKPVAGATAHITSLYNGKTADAVTDSNGIAVLDARELCEPDPDQQPGEVQQNYCFFGSVVVQKDGYRTFETGKMRFIGAEELAVATEPTDGHPYARMAAFDDWDIQYADSATFPATPANRDSHALVVKTEVSDGRPVRVTAYQEGGASFQTDATPDASGLAVATLEGRFLSTHADDASQAFAPDKPVFITVATDAGGGESFTFESNLVVKRGHLDEASFEPGQRFSLDELVPNEASDADLSPDNGDLSVTLPESIPVIGGGSIKLPIPFLPVTIETDPLSYIFIAAKLSMSLHKGTDGRGDKNVWTRDTYENCSSEAFRTAQDALQSYLNKNAGIADTKRSALTKVPGGFGFSPSLEVGFGLYQTWNDQLLVWRGDAKGYVELTLNLSYTLQFFIAWFPVYVLFEFIVDAYLALEAGMEFVDAGEKTKPQFSGGSGFTFTPKLEIAVGAGAGMSGAASIGVRGSGFLSFPINALFSPRGKPNPHMNLDGGVDVAICAQFIVYKGSIPLYAGRWNNIWTNWPDDKKSLEAGEAFTSAHKAFFVNTPDGGYGYSMAGDDAHLLQGGDGVNASFVPVTNSELAGTAELRAVAQNDGSYAYEEARAESATTGQAYAITPLALGAEGLKPTETLVYKHVFSDPRQKVFSVDGVIWIARIVPVTYPEGTRTRLTVAKMENGVMGRPQVVEFDFADYKDADGHLAPCARINAFDCDFDVVGCDEGCRANRWKDGGAFRVLLTMVTRPDGDASPLTSVASHSIAAFLSVGDDLSIKTKHLFFDDYNRTDRAAIRLYPRIVGRPEYSDTTAAFALHRIAEPGKTVFDPGYKEYPSDCQFHSSGSILFTKGGFTDVPDDCFSDATGSLAAATDILADAKQDVAISIIFSPSALIYLLCYNMAVSDDEKQAPIVKVLRVVHTFVGDRPYTATVLSTNAGRAYSLNRWRNFRPDGSDAVMLADGRSLTALWYSSSQVHTQTVQLDESIHLDNFKLSRDGKLLYFATVLDGKQEDKIDQDGNRTPGKEVHEYRIRASRIVTDASGAYKFMEPFTIAQLDHPADALVDLPLPKSYGFLSNSITSLADSASDLYLYAVPKLAHLSLIGFTPIGKTVCAGNEETFLVTVRNDGNTAIDSFTLVVADESGEVGRIPVSIPDVQAVLEAKDAPNDSDALLGWYGAAPAEDLDTGAGLRPGLMEVQPVADVPTEAGVVLPGKQRTYRFNWTVPEQWHGETLVDVSIDLGSLTVSTQPGCCELEEVRTQAVGALELGMPANSLQNSISVELPLATAQYEGVEDIPVDRSAYLRTDGKGDAIAPPSGTSDERPASGKGSGLGSTGDPLTGTVAAALVAAMGAGAAAAAVHARKRSEGKTGSEEEAR